MKIYSTEDVLEGLYPTRQDILTVHRQLLELLDQHPRVFLGAVIGGSLTTDPDTVTGLSDVDGISIYLNKSQDKAKKLIAGWRQSASILHVPTRNMHFLPEKLARTGQHTITPGFRRHLEWAATSGGQVGRPILAWLSPGPVDEITSLKLYLSHKLEVLAYLEFAANLNHVPEHFQLVEAILTAPFYSTLRLMDIFGLKVEPCNMARITQVASSLQDVELVEPNLVVGMVEQLSKWLQDRADVLMAFNQLAETRSHHAVKAYHDVLRQVTSSSSQAMKMLTQIGAWTLYA